MGAAMGSPAFLMWTVLFSSIGLGMFIYGRRQRMIVPFVTGLALMLYPYFIANTWFLVLAGAALLAVPYFVRF